MTGHDYEAEISAFIVAEFLPDEPDVVLDRDESLLDAEVLDSLAMFVVAEHLELTYGISVSEPDMTVENFETVGAIAGLVRRKLGESRPAGGAS